MQVRLLRRTKSNHVLICARKLFFLYLSYSKKDTSLRLGLDRCDEVLDVFDLVVFESSMQERGVAGFAEVPLSFRFRGRTVQPRQAFQRTIGSKYDRVLGVARVPTDLASLHLALQRGIDRRDREAALGSCVRLSHYQSRPT